MTGNLLFLEKSTPPSHRNRYKAVQDPEIRTKIVVALEKCKRKSLGCKGIDSGRLLLRMAVKNDAAFSTEMITAFTVFENNARLLMMPNYDHHH